MIKVSGVKEVTGFVTRWKYWQAQAFFLQLRPGIVVWAADREAAEEQVAVKWLENHMEGKMPSVQILPQELPDSPVKMLRMKKEKPAFRISGVGCVACSREAGTKLTYINLLETETLPGEYDRYVPQVSFVTTYADRTIRKWIQEVMGLGAEKIAFHTWVEVD